jgi:acetate kinase
MLILTLNCGSSSVKAMLMRMPDEQRMLDLRVTDIGSEESSIEMDGSSSQRAIATHAEAIQVILDTVRSSAHESPDAVAHRVVHGGPKFTQPVAVDDAVARELDALNELAPLHNPVAVAGIAAARAALPSIPNVAVFDTAFHATLPPHAREYALPRELNERIGIRRYGFHGTNHAHVAHSAAHYLQRPLQSLRVISCHLGNGASVAAIEHGRSIDTSMGMTPLEGLVMGTRAGDIDAGVLLHLLRTGEYDAAALDDLLNRQSGLKGLTGSSDMRAVERRAAAGEEACQRALASYAYRVRKYIGAYAAALGGVDVIVFTAGVGENGVAIRRACVERLEHLGARLDANANERARVTVEEPVSCISTADSRVAVLVVRADEELAMARETHSLLTSSTNAP